ncbi:GNAT family N-acetyltransferase [Thalassovita mangrovi]|uniref:GNAT family N-acetyltransferase n=1 Tax=Thalassovita mangrovi TaxID=2692236 RepID=A0A6L8LD86_9RHOB|nr:GNAT family N-acetyltransferase [Thalassovita mangrovi]MYM53991.1 GNAT family N-acetyltransferase [Thalassovita mangrovi]
MTALHLAGPDDLDRLLPLVRAFHEEHGIARSDDDRIAGLQPIVEGSPHGVAYLIGPQRAPIGYIVISFGWSLEFGGMDGFVDEIYLRPSIRGRGIGSEVLTALPKALAGAGLKALHLEVKRDDEKTRRFYSRLRFAEREDYMLMTLEF